LNKLLELHAEKKITLLTPIVAAPIEGLSDVEMSELLELCNEKKMSLSGASSTNILHTRSSSPLISVGTALIDSPLGLGIYLLPAPQ